jgi:hypothetical protein
MVFMERDCWYGHILQRRNRRMRHRLVDVKSTIQNSERVDIQTVDSICNRVYFRRWKDRDPYGNEYLKVATEVIDMKQKWSRVLTAVPLWVLPPSSRS